MEKMLRCLRNLEIHYNLLKVIITKVGLEIILKKNLALEDKCQPSFKEVVDKLMDS